MSTRGFLGFVAEGAEKIGYNHSDSYPSCLGKRTLEWLLKCDQKEAVEAATALRVVDGNSQPSDEDIAALGQYANTHVGGRSDRVTWYQLLRETQGDAAAILDAGAIEDASQFPVDSLFAEWGYVVDFDAGTFEVYRGFQKSPHTEGRFAGRTPDPSSPGYYPVRLAASWPLAELPTVEQFMATVDPDDDEG